MGEVPKLYKCPTCFGKKTEEIITRNANALEVKIMYGNCFMKFEREGAVWKLLNAWCAKFDGLIKKKE